LDWFGSGKETNVAELIAKKKYAKAIELLRAQFHQGNRDARMRLQFADVLVLAGKGKEAVPILIGLADEYAREGFAAKAIALLKKIEKIAPGRQDTEQRLAELINDKKVGNVPLKPRGSVNEIGMQEMYEPSAVSFEPKPETEPPKQPAPPPPPSSLAPAGEPEYNMSEDLFGDLLVEVAQQVSQQPATADAQASAAKPDGVVASPLFSDFSQEELLAVMRGLRLLSFDAGDIIITEGEPGDSLFILTTGAVKAFVRNPAGRHVQVREMNEGSFFGEISVLSGRPRTATVTAASHCELLELDKATLDSITATHPHVREVLEEFYRERSGSADETLVRSMSFGQKG
jgi:hypothetical protein